MSLYKNWTDMVIEFVKTRGEAEFWKEYGSIEKHIYSKLLAEHNDAINGTIKDLAEKYETTTVFFMGFLDGINDSLVESLDLENLEETSEINAKVNFEKLYFNMLDAKADYLYGLPQWEAIFSPEKRKEIRQSWVASKTIVNKNKVGRNDPCPCGSGKKYKQCCGKNA
ncbi:SEC-C metal-binding domain-containing protein [Clostridium sp. CX1]|uniref:SEC-C metal-binding domain-containing protein n=1 Tax=Clostridium tanneri TaxID=3037988 RepID=A0ABU4JU06_9CLOT|nr:MULTISPECIES: SEC-C metal-binding domain-containing protein [unclassified Clostridium]MCT8977531.1 SEC-C metal-binding domain-containing protein [Clostridium sp. CX1]MDW8801635.1 SEC-C metal-binding domain-containing protein [Clostridium sp. A1-XYC3]